jgi:hypothetical protein
VAWGFGGDGVGPGAPTGGLSASALVTH